MTAITIADRSTLNWEDTALGPKTFERPPVLSEDQRMEHQLYQVTPELEHLAQAEWDTVQRWLSFKMAPHFVEQIYKGELLELTHEAAVQEHLMPESRVLQDRYLKESAYIIEAHIPAIERRIQDYTGRAKDLEESSTYNQFRIANGELSPQLKYDADSWNRQAKRMRRTVQELSTDIPNLQMGAKVKDAMFYKINDFVTRSEDQHDTSGVERIVLESKMIALQQVIIQYKSDRALADGESEDEQTIVRGYDRAIELLQTELEALQAIAQSEARTADLGEVEQPTNILSFRQKILGGFSSKAAALYGALTR